jgi:CHAD domain-containing protein
MSTTPEKVAADRLLSARWHRHTEALADSLPAAVDGDDPRDVQAALEALRRLRSWIATWETLLDDERVAAIDLRLISVESALGRMHDVDVIETTMMGAADRVAFAQLATSSLQRELIHRRHSAQVHARSTVDPSELISDIEMVDGTIEYRPAAHQRATRVLPSLAKVQWRNLLRRVEALPDPIGPSDLHPVMVAARRCRNGALDLTPAVGKPARRYAKALTRLHVRLAHLDHAVMTADFLDHRGRMGGPTSATNSGLLRGITLTVVADDLESWPGWWARTSRRKIRTWW